MWLLLAFALWAAKAPAPQVTALFFITHDCPIANSYAPKIRSLCNEYAKRGVSCKIVYADPSLSDQQMRKHQQDYALSTIPALVDREHQLIRTYQPKVTPEAVVVNLGTNDFTGSSPPQQPFEAAYEAFVVTLRKNYPSAYILAITGGPMLTGTASTNEQAWVKNVVTKLKTAGDSRIGATVLPVQTGSHGGIGCDYHPSVGEHTFMADELAKAIGPALGW